MENNNSEYNLFLDLGQTFLKFVHCLDPAITLSFYLSFPIWPYISTLLTPPEAQSLQRLRLDLTSHGLEPSQMILTGWLWITSIISLLKSLPVQTDPVFPKCMGIFPYGLSPLSDSHSWSLYFDIRAHEWCVLNISRVVLEL